MAITDLTGTKWKFKENITLQESNQYLINYTCNNVSYSKFIFYSSPVLQSGYFFYFVFPSSTYIGYARPETTYEYSWVLRDTGTIEAPTIEIIDGTDVTNATFIAWLQANATQVITKTENVFIGSSKMSDGYVGTKQIKAIYNGSKLVYGEE